MIRRSAGFQLACLLLALFFLVGIAGAETDCDFSKYTPRRINHFDRLAINKAVPKYPPAAKAEGITGKVQLKILVNKEGFVERACPMHESGAPKPDQRLIAAAEAAALQWTFQPNFGFTVIGELKLNYVEAILTFEFVIQPDEKK